MATDQPSCWEVGSVKKGLYSEILAVASSLCAADV